jgi:formylglycine-generating enzyme required for sulfatase activity
MPDRDDAMLQIDGDYVRANSVRMPECVFPFGTKLEHAAPGLLEVDRKKHLSIGSILDSTPLCWVHLPEFWIGRGMVTNGQYKAFLDYCEDEESGTRLFDLPDVWNYVWSELNYRVHSVKMPMRGSDGRTYEIEEDYSDCSGFVEAYVNSLKFEMKRVLMGSEAADGGGEGQVVTIKRKGQKTQRIELPGQELVPRLFAYIRYALRDAIVGPGEDGFSYLNDAEISVVERYKSFEQIDNDAMALITQLKTGYMQAIDRRFVQAFGKGQFRVAPILFLERVRSALSASKDITKPIALSEVLYPRYWDSPSGKKGRDFLKRRASWDDVPVEGVTLYEALAFTVWLSGISNRMVIQLPNEAEYERAASWPAEELPEGGKEIVLDPAEKALLPWQKRNDKDFNYYFGNEGKEVDEYYVANRAKYEELLEETARGAGEETLYHLTGFGWQWTLDRYDERERKYNRFESAEYPVYEERACKLKDGQQVKVYDYEPNRNVRSSYYVMRGAPDVLGGPGLVTRRYSAYPLRGYRKVGFRWAIKAQE